MQTIERFEIPDAPESTVELPAGLKLIDVDLDMGNGVDIDDTIVVYYMDSRASDETVTLTWYALGEGVEVPDGFPGQFFKRVIMCDGSRRFIFFKQNAKKRAPIVAHVPGAKPKDAE